MAGLVRFTQCVKNKEKNMDVLVQEEVARYIMKLMENKNGWSMLKIIQIVEEEYGLQYKNFARNYIMNYCNM
jgi:hypothetical protein|tara:strand:+ start:1063 stop:1278 length:216 start_codon:yes stop_codon:yes gene_type:complete